MPTTETMRNQQRLLHPPRYKGQDKVQPPTQGQGSPSPQLRQLWRTRSPVLDGRVLPLL